MPKERKKTSPQLAPGNGQPAIPGDPAVISPALAKFVVPIDSLSLDPANVRKHDRKSIDGIKAALRRFGQQHPIVRDAAGVVRVGNGRLAAAKELGWKSIAVIESNLSGSELTAMAIADNKTAELSEFDDDLLAQQLRALADEGVGIAELGFDAKEIEKILEQDAADLADAAPVDPPPPGRFMVLVICRDEADQKEMLAGLAGDGRECRALIE